MFFKIKSDYVTDKHYSINLRTEDKLCSRSGGNLFQNMVYMICLQTVMHDHPWYLCCPEVLSTVGDPLSGNGYGSPTHI